MAWNIQVNSVEVSAQARKLGVAEGMKGEDALSRFL